jgi:hypothetical protein
VWQQIAPVNGGEDAEEDRYLDGAGGVEPPIVVVMQLEASLEIVQRDGDCLGARLPGNLVDLLLEGGLTGRGSAHTG